MDTSLRHNEKDYRKAAPYKVGMIVVMYVEQTINSLDGN